MPNRPWGFLKSFAIQGGILPFKALKEKDRINFKKYVSDLRKRIGALIPGIEGDIITYDRKEKTYQTAFRISSEGSLQFPTPDGATWAHVTISANGPTSICIRVAAPKRFASSVYADENDHSTHQWEGAEREGKVERNYDLRMLKLADDQDRPNRTGQAILAVLSGKGTVKRKANDKGMNELCGVLSTLMQIDESPFRFSQLEEKWIACFGVGD